MLQFKREGSGTWQYGQRGTVVEGDSHWAVNPMSFKWGSIAFNDNNKVVGERVVPVTQTKPDVTALPDTGFKWVDQWSVNMKCLNGTDAGVEVVFKTTTVGGVQSIAGMIDAIRDRLNGDQHDGKVAPVVRLDKDSYQHSQYGRVWTPVLATVDWMPLDGPAPEPKSSPTEPPRRRRVA